MLSLSVNPDGTYLLLPRREVKLQLSRASPESAKFAPHVWRPFCPRSGSGATCAPPTLAPEPVLLSRKSRAATPQPTSTRRAPFERTRLSTRIEINPTLSLGRRVQPRESDRTAATSRVGTRPGARRRHPPPGGTSSARPRLGCLSRRENRKRWARR